MQQREKQQLHMVIVCTVILELAFYMNSVRIAVTADLQLGIGHR